MLLAVFAASSASSAVIMDARTGQNASAVFIARQPEGSPLPDVRCTCAHAPASPRLPEREQLARLLAHCYASSNTNNFIFGAEVLGWGNGRGLHRLVAGAAMLRDSAAGAARGKGVLRLTG